MNIMFMLIIGQFVITLIKVCACVEGEAQSRGNVLKSLLFSTKMIFSLKIRTIKDKAWTFYQIKQTRTHIPAHTRTHSHTFQEGC